jgi:hypothetical protein
MLAGLSGFIRSVSPDRIKKGLLSDLSVSVVNKIIPGKTDKLN